MTPASAIAFEMAGLTPREIRRLFELLNEELHRAQVSGELYLVGGAVMCLAHHARPSTADVDAVFKPAAEIRKAAARAAAKARLPAEWLNDAVKGYLSAEGEFAPFIELDHLRIMIARPEYLLAMKCLAMRIGAGSHDEEDVRFLLRLLDIRSYDQAVKVIGRYYPLERFPRKTLYALEQILPKG